MLILFIIARSSDNGQSRMVAIERLHQITEMIVIASGRMVEI